MKAIILVGGEGTRLRPLTYATVKAMVPVLNRPFIQYMIRHLASHNINEIILAMGYKSDTIKSYFDKFDKPDVRLVYSIEDTPLGTAGAVKNAEKHIDGVDTFFVFNGDVFTDLDLTDMLNFHKNHKAKATIALTQVDDPTKFGVVEIDDQQKVNCFIDRKESLWETRKEGIEIVGLKEAMKRGNKNFIVTSLFSISEIKDYIEEMFEKTKEKARIYTV